MSLELRNPESWLDLSLHPVFAGKPFDRNWYDGDVDGDLLLLRHACVEITVSLPECETELVVLDDCTFFARLDCGKGVSCELYPSMTSNEQRCLFFVFPTLPDLEIRVLTSQDAKTVMLAFSQKKDLSVFERID